MSTAFRPRSPIPGRRPSFSSRTRWHRRKAEKQAWPYAWFKLGGYVPESGRGTVTGKLAIADPGNPHASAANIWVGLEQQPPSLHQNYDFQKYAKPYQFWVQTGADGSFRIPHVIAGSNYTLWAFGPGAAGTFLSQNQTGGQRRWSSTCPPSRFAVTVTAGSPTDLGTVTWTPLRVGATVFELGYPDRKADKFRHGEDYWVPEPSPKLGYPTPIWGGEPEFPLDNPNGIDLHRRPKPVAARLELHHSRTARCDGRLSAGYGNDHL